MIHLYGVTELVNKNIVDNLKRKLHERDIKTDSSITTTTSPSAAGMRKSHLFVDESILLGEKCKTFCKVAFSLSSECIYDRISYDTNNGWILQCLILWQRDN